MGLIDEERRSARRINVWHPSFFAFAGDEMKAALALGARKVRLQELLLLELKGEVFSLIS